MKMFAERIKKLRTINNLSQQQLAEKLNINQSQVAKWEKYDLEPSLTTLYALGNLFGISTDYFIGLDSATINLKLKIKQGTWLKYFVENPSNTKIKQFKKDCEEYEINFGNTCEYQKLNSKERIVFFAKNAERDAECLIPPKENLQYKEYLAAHALKEDIKIEEKFFAIIYEILPAKFENETVSPCPNYFEVREKILNYYDSLKPYCGLLNYF